jgi:hypothetical protein
LFESALRQIDLVASNPLLRPLLGPASKSPHPAAARAPAIAGLDARQGQWLGIKHLPAGYQPGGVAMVNPFDPKTALLAKHAQPVGLIHFPIALFIAAVRFDFVAQWRRRHGRAALTGHPGGFPSGVNGPVRVLRWREFFSPFGKGPGIKAPCTSY